MRLLAFRIGLLFIFVRFSLLHEVLAYMFDVNTYILLILGAISVTGVVITGGIRRTLRHRSTIFWALFAAWIGICIPFSSWPTDSVSLVTWVCKTELPVMFVVAGLAVTWKEFKQILYTLAAALLVNEASSRMFSDESGRLGLGFGSIGNANDYAAHLLMMLPFALFMVLKSGRGVVRKIFFALVFLAGLFLAAKTGSRGAMLAAVACVILIFVKGTRVMRMACLIGVPVFLAVILVALPTSTLMRYATLFGEHDTEQIITNEAAGSQATRTYLLKTSLKFTFTHPIFGIGPGQFSNMEGLTAKENGFRGAWQVSHNSYTQASSEAGIPALILMLIGLVSGFRLLSSIHRQARANPQFRDIQAAAFCLMLAMTAFCTACLFLSMAYRFYMPAICGLAVCFAFAARREFARAALLRPAA